MAAGCRFRITHTFVETFCSVHLTHLALCPSLVLPGQVAALVVPSPLVEASSKVLSRNSAQALSVEGANFNQQTTLIFDPPLPEEQGFRMQVGRFITLSVLSWCSVDGVTVVRPQQ